jgi:hypothetical protein
LVNPLETSYTGPTHPLKQSRQMLHPHGNARPVSSTNRCARSPHILHRISLLPNDSHVSGESLCARVTLVCMALGIG